MHDGVLHTWMAAEKKGAIEMIQIKRVYDPPAPDDGIRYLIDRIWPRGVRKEDLQVDEWLKEVAPSTGLRKWFGHEPEKWPEFQNRYETELEENPEAWRPIFEAARQGNVTLLYAARNQEHNNAVALKRYIDRKLAEHNTPPVQ